MNSDDLIYSFPPPPSSAVNSSSTSISGHEFGCVVLIFCCINHINSSGCHFQDGVHQNMIAARFPLTKHSVSSIQLEICPHQFLSLRISDLVSLATHFEGGAFLRQPARNSLRSGGFVRPSGPKLICSKILSLFFFPSAQFLLTIC